MEKKGSGGRLRAFLSFTASAAVSLAVFLAGGFFMLRLQDAPEEKSGDLPAAVDSPEFAVLLIVGDDDDGGEALFFTLSIKTAQKAAFIESVPEREARLAGHTDTVHGFAERYGFSTAVEAARVVTAKNITRYLQADRAVFAEVCDALGGVEIDEGGPLRLFGSHLEERVAAGGGEAKSALAALFTAVFADETTISTASKIMFSRCETDISASDVLGRQAALRGTTAY